MVKYNLSFVFKGSRREVIRSFHIVPYFSIQINNKLDIKVQSVTKIIVLGAKCAIKKFKVQSVIRNIV